MYVPRVNYHKYLQLSQTLRSPLPLYSGTKISFCQSCGTFSILHIRSMTPFKYPANIFMDLNKSRQLRLLCGTWAWWQWFIRLPNVVCRGETTSHCRSLRPDGFSCKLSPTGVIRIWPADPRLRSVSLALLKSHLQTKKINEIYNFLIEKFLN